MRKAYILLSGLIMTLEIVPAWAVQCDKLGAAELAARYAKLPAFIVVPPGSTFDSAVSDALHCSPSPPPTFAGGGAVDLKEVVGKEVFGEDGGYIGSVAGLAIDPDTTKTKSLVRMDFDTGPKTAAVPFESLSHAAKTGFIILDANKSDLEAKWPVGSSTERFGVEAVVWSSCYMCGYQLFPIDVQSDPSRGTIFVGEERWGTTEIKGAIRYGKESTIRIEYPKRKSCTFAEGTYKTALESGLGYATFYCKLPPLAR